MIRKLAFTMFLFGLPGVGAAQKLGAPPAALESPYKTEHAWAIREIVEDINEIARYRAKMPAAPAFTEAVVPWHPELLIAYAATQLAGGVAKPNETDPPEQHGKLLTLSPDEIVKASAVVSASLKREMHNPRAHEAAAIVLAAFGLREAADAMSDVRWVLNRMTAHLAIAQALRNGQSKPSVDGQIAEAALLALSGRQRTSAAAVASLAPTTPALAAWQRALRIRLTEDWRLLATPPTATRLEKLEYFRARRHTVRETRAGQDLTDMREPIAVDFGRIVQLRQFGVDDGNLVVVDGVQRELDEVAFVYRQLHQREMPNNLPASILNVRAGRLLANGEPQVVPWGAWAEFSQRHIGMSIQQVDWFTRHTLGVPERADQFKAKLDAFFGHFTMYPIASTGRTKGRKGTEADLSQIGRAIDVAVRAPELVTFYFWTYMENGSNYEPVVRGMPTKKTWFVAPTAEVPYDVNRRAETTLASLTPSAVDALIDEAPYNISLISRVVQRLWTNRPLMAKVRTLIEPRVEYDMWSIDSAINIARDPEDRIALRRKACQLVVRECLELAWELADTDEAAAAAEYEKAFRNPALDEVVMSNSSAWLVSYYERSGQLIRAMDLAQRSAATWSARGMLTLARLLERRARIEEADEFFSKVGGRYPDSSTDLAGFLYRQAIVAKNPAYLERWKAAERKLFPDGLQPMAATMREQPSKGVFIEQDSYWSKRVRLQAGDIIVGVDGWKVENLEQYKTVIGFLPQNSRHKFTAWRGVLFTVDLYAGHGMTLKTHPLKGWIE